MWKTAAQEKSRRGFGAVLVLSPVLPSFPNRPSPQEPPQVGHLLLFPPQDYPTRLDPRHPRM